MKKKLASDVTSYRKDDGVTQYYGKAGDEVTVIGQHGEIIIVENNQGERFPVNEKYLINEHSELHISIDTNPVEKGPVEKLCRKKKPKSSGSKRLPPAPSLFAGGD